MTYFVAAVQSPSAPTTSKRRKFGRPSIYRLRGKAATLRATSFCPICTGGLRRNRTAQHRQAPTLNANRRTVIVGTSAAAAAAVAAVSIDRALIDGSQVADGGRELTPNSGSWMRVAASADVTDGVMRPFDVGSVIGFVRRVNGKPEAVSGVCTHQGCRLWFDAPDDRLRCPCHSTSFAPAGQVLTHQLPIAPKPLPTLMVREQDGAIEVFVPAPRNEPA